MPGLFGVIDACPVRSEAHQRELTTIAGRMSAAMQFESFYSDVIVSLPSLGACVGRVGFCDVAAPRAPAGEPTVLAMTAGDEIAAGLGCDDPAVDERFGPGASDVIRAYERAGADGPAGLPGIRTAFVADPPGGRCLLFTDRYGKERLYFHIVGERVLFSSEAKAILAAAPSARAFDPTGLAQLLASGSTLGPRSLFRDIEVLDGGTVLTFEGADRKRRRYFDCSRLEQLTPTPAAEFLDRLSQGLRSAVAGCVRCPPRVGISVTGGLDSRMVMASLDAAPGTVPCYTFGSMYGTTGDVAVGRRVAELCAQPHQVLELGREFLESASDCLDQAVYISDGYLGLSGAAELYVNRQARQLAPARMTGNWGGELMRGVRAFKYLTPKGNFLTPQLASLLIESAASFSTASSNPLSAALFQQMPFQGYGRYAIERSQVATRSPFLADEVVACLYQAPAAVRESKSTAAVVISRRPGLLTIPTDLGLLGGGPSFFRRASRRALIKAEYLTSHGAPHWVARISAQLPAGVLETRFLGLDKFQHFRFWIRNQLAVQVRQTLIHDVDRDLGSWFDLSRVAQLVNDHIDGRANYTDEIDKLLTVAVAQKTLLRRFGGTP